jgi:hypothetical protein
VNREQHAKVSFAYIILVCLLAPYLIIPERYFNHLGMACISIILTLTLFFYKSKRQKFDALLSLFWLVLAVFVAIRSNELTTFLNLIALLGIWTLLASPTDSLISSTFLDVLVSPFRIFIDTLLSKHKLVSLVQEFSSSARIKMGRRIVDYLIPAIISLISLVVIVPLLASANPIFKDLVQNVLQVFSFEFQDVWVARAVFFVPVIVLLPKLLELIQQQTPSSQPKITLPSAKSLVLPKVLVSLVLLVFIGTHMELYFASSAQLQQLGYSNSRLTNEIFAQLILVCSIVFALIYNETSQSKTARFTSGLLIVQALVLNAFALKSDLDYINQWGFTTKRLFGLVGFGLVLGVFVLHILKQKFMWTIPTFVRSTVILFIATLILINASNFDYIIFKYAPHTNTLPTDHVYLSKLSTDSKHLNDHFKYLNLEFTKGNRDWEVLTAYTNVLMKIADLQTKYDNAQSWQSFNLSEYLAYKSVKDVNHSKLLEEVVIYQRNQYSNGIGRENIRVRPSR